MIENSNSLFQASRKEGLSFKSEHRKDFSKNNAFSLHCKISNKTFPFFLCNFVNSQSKFTNVATLHSGLYILFNLEGHDNKHSFCFHSGQNWRSRWKQQRWSQQRRECNCTSPAQKRLPKGRPGTATSQGQFAGWKQAQCLSRCHPNQLQSKDGTRYGHCITDFFLKILKNEKIQNFFKIKIQKNIVKK